MLRSNETLAIEHVSFIPSSVLHGECISGSFLSNVFDRRIKFKSDGFLLTRFFYMFEQRQARNIELDRSIDRAKLIETKRWLCAAAFDSFASRRG